MTQSQENIDAWADGMLNEATTEMHEKSIEITPDNFSKYFEENYQLPWTPYEAAIWLTEKGYNKTPIPTCETCGCPLDDDGTCPACKEGK